MAHLGSIGICAPKVDPERKMSYRADRRGNVLLGYKVQVDRNEPPRRIYPLDFRRLFVILQPAAPPPPDESDAS